MAAVFGLCLALKTNVEGRWASGGGWGFEQESSKSHKKPKLDQQLCLGPVRLLQTKMCSRQGLAQNVGRDNVL